MRLDRDELLNHIDDSEKLIEIKKIIDKIEIVLNNHSEQSTDFLDPYEISLAVSILNRFDEISYLIDGGYEDAERKIILIYPSYLYETTLDDLMILNISTKSKLEHKDILGSLIGLGIDRRKLGDIIINKDNYSFFVKREISDFIEFNLEKIGNNNVKLNLVKEIEIPKPEYNEFTYIISSLRLDVIISSVLKLSRANAQKIIEQEKVKVNFKKENKPSILLNESDIISVRKYGRFIFDKIEGMSKKKKYIVNVKIPK